MAVNDNSVVVSIVGDASGIRPAVDLTQSELNSLEATIRDLSSDFARFGSELKQSMDLGARETQQLTNEMKELNRAIERDELSMRQLGAATRTTGAQMGAMGGFVKGAIQGMIAAFTVQAVVSFTGAMGDAAERADQLAQQTGMTVAEVQALDIALAGTNLKMEDVAKGLGILATKAEVSGEKTNAAGNALRAMGIDAKDSSGNLDRLLKIADQFKEMEDGPRKAALAMQLFGKSGKDLIPFLNQGSAAIREQMALAERYGVINQRATELALGLDAALDEQKIAWAGLKQTMTEAFAPLLTEIVRGFNELVAAMVKSYNEGGAVKVIFDGIVLAIQAIREILSVVGMAFAELFSGVSDAEGWSSGMQSAMQAVVDGIKICVAAVVTMVDAFKVSFHLIYAAALTFKANWQEATGGIKIIGLALGLFIQNLARAIENALLLRWGQIRSDWDAGMENLRRTVSAKGKEIIAEAAATRAQVQKEMAAAAGIAASHQSFMKNLGIGKPIEMPKGETGKLSTGGGGLAAPGFAPTGGGSKGASGDSIAEKLERELEAKKTAWAIEQDAQGQMHRFSLQAEADFWEQALKRTDLGTKDKLAIEKKYVAARQALRREEIDKQLDGYKAEIEAVGANSDAKLSILREEQAFVVRMYGVESREARQAAEAIVRAERDKQRQLRELKAAINAGEEAKAMAEIAQAEAAAEFEVEIGRSSKGKLIQLERQFEIQRFQIRRQSLLRAQALIDPTRDPEKYQQASQQIEALERQHQNKLTDIDRRATLQRTQIQRGAINQVSNSWGNAIAGMITLQTSWRDGLIQIWQGLVSTIANVISQIVSTWIAGLLTKAILGKAEASSGIMAEAARAGAGGTASMAAAPFPINMTAPAFGASMFAAAAAYEGMLAVPGFDVGAWELSKDQLAMVHSGEMIIPENLAGGMRSLMKSAAASPNGSLLGRDPTKSSSQQNNHFSYSPTINHSNQSLNDMLKDNERQMRRWFMNQVRNGSLKIPVS